MSEEAVVTVEQATGFEDRDIGDLCEATIAAIRHGGGFGWLEPPARRVLESYWRGVVLVPERALYLGRLDGTIAGAVQLVRPPRNNEAQSFQASLVSLFVAPWARGRGMALRLVEALEDGARAAGAMLINLDLRATQTAAIRLFEQAGYERWGEHPYYARVGDRFVRGYYYCKFIDRDAAAQHAPRDRGGAA